MRYGFEYLELACITVLTFRLRVIKLRESIFIMVREKVLGHYVKLNN